MRGSGGTEQAIAELRRDRAFAAAAELARLARENAELKAENRELRRFVRLADGCAQAVAEGCDSLTNVR